MENKLTNACQVLDYINEIIAAIKYARKTKDFTHVGYMIDFLKKSSNAMDALKNGGFPDELSRADRISSLASVYARTRGYVKYDEEEKCLVGGLRGFCGDCCDGEHIDDVHEQLYNIAYDCAADLLDDLAYIDENGEMKSKPLTL